MSTRLKQTTLAIPLGETSVGAESVPKKSTYGQILKSTAMIGGASVVNIGISIVRTKALALFLGPGGLGLIGLFTSILELTRSIAGMGINNSGVRQIAAAAATQEPDRIARTAIALRRISIVLGLVGAALLIAFCIPISELTFGSREKAFAVASLSIALFLNLVSDGQGALIAGMRRIADLARMWMLGGICGTLATIILVYFFKEKGIVPSLIAVAATSLAMSWWFSRRVGIQETAMTRLEFRFEVRALLRLGAVFMASGLLTTGAAFAVRAIVIRKLGLDAAGYYQSAWALGGMYVGLILQSMGADFYPRLTGAAKDNLECNRLVNEQAEVGLLMAGPGVIATLTFAPVVIALFYTREFAPAVEPLRWLCLGLMLRVIAWPMGFIVLAQNLQRIFFWTELVSTSMHVGLAWIAVQYFGLAGAGMAFFGQYVWHSILIYVVVRRRTGFRWSAANKRIGPLILSLTGLVFIGFYLLPFWGAITLGSAATMGSGIYSMRTLAVLIPPDRMPRLMRRVLALFRFLPSNPKG